MTSTVHVPLSMGGPEPNPTESPGVQRTEESMLNCWDPEANNPLCAFVYDTTNNEALAQWSNTLLVRPFMILLILVIAILLRWLIHRAIDRFTKRAEKGETTGTVTGPRAVQKLKHAADGDPIAAERRTQRLATMGSLLKSITTGVIFAIAMFMIVAELGYNIAPLIASAGIIGVALGFGAQSLVQDFLSGLFMIIEDQYGVGDIVDLGEAVGTVEAVGLRVTRARSLDGTVWYVRNGEIMRVGNFSYGWARAVLDIPVGYGQDIDRIRTLITEVCEQVASEEKWSRVVLEPPEVWGVEALNLESVIVRAVIKTRAAQQWALARELRERVKDRFDAEDIEMPNLSQLWARGVGPAGPANE